MFPLSLHLLLCVAGTVAARMALVWKARRMAERFGHMT